MAVCVEYRIATAVGKMIALQNVLHINTVKSPFTLIICHFVLFMINAHSQNSHAAKKCNQNIFLTILLPLSLQSSNATFYQMLCMSRIAIVI